MAIGPDDDRRQVLETITARACHGLFSQYGVELRQVAREDEPVSPAFLLCSVISFSGRPVRGTLVLAVTEALAADSMPPGAVVAARDWVGELSNQLLGHIKIELLRHGVEIYLNLPAVLRGEHLAPLPRKTLEPLKFVASSGAAAALWVEAEISPEFQLGDPDDDAGPRSGDMLLFD